MTITCAHCGQLFETFALHAKMTPRRFCSQLCVNATRKLPSLQGAFLKRIGQPPDTAQCWEWPTRSDKAIVSVGDKRYSAIRVAYEMFCGTLEAVDLVLHHCNNARCCNPRHLYKGTAKERNEKAKPIPPLFHCEQCGKSYRAHPSHVQNGTRKHCSYTCAARARRLTALNMSAADRFLSAMGQPPKNDNCWEWSGRHIQHGYGVISILTGNFLTHRIAYELFCGPVDPNLFVCHRCDNPPCCNPRHLFIGTANDNIQDAVKKDRHARGERNAQAKLSAEKVREIRIWLACKVSQKRIAAVFGVTDATISMINTGKHWKHVS